MPVQTSSKISHSPLSPGSNRILPGGEIKAHSRSDACSLAWPSSLNMGAPFGAGKLKFFSTTLPLTDSNSCKIEEGVYRAARGTLGEECHSLTHQAPGEVSAGFVKHRESGAQKRLVDLAQLALFLYPISQPRSPSCLPVGSGDGNPRRDEKWQCSGP